MRFIHSDIDAVFDIDTSYISTLVIESPSLFRKVIKDISLSIDGSTTPAVLSKNNETVDFGKNAELICDLIYFNINQKPLLNKILSSLERSAVSPDNYLETQELLGNIESSISKWAFDFPCDIIATKITTATVLKAVGIELNNDYEGEAGDAERIIDYMELVREFDRDKLFITVNMRSFISDEVMTDFMRTAISHEYKLLMIDSVNRPMLPFEKRVTVDEDLCIF